MNIAEQAYHDGQECRKANGKQIAGEALENQAMEEFWHTGLDFQHWQHYHDNWMSGYQSVEDEPKEQAFVNTIDDTCAGYMRHPFKESLFHNDFDAFQTPFFTNGCPA